MLKRRYRFVVTLIVLIPEKSPKMKQKKQTWSKRITINIATIIIQITVNYSYMLKLTCVVNKAQNSYSIISIAAIVVVVPNDADITIQLSGIFFLSQRERVREREVRIALHLACSISCKLIKPHNLVMLLSNFLFHINQL